LTGITRLRYRGLLALIVTACLSVGAKAPAQQPAAPVPSIEELKRQLEEKRLEAKRQLETKRQLDLKQQQDAKQQLEAKQQDAKQQLEAKQQDAKQRLEAKQQQEAKQQDAKQQLEAKRKQPKVPPQDGESAAAPTPVRASAPPADVGRPPPIGKNIAPVKLEPNSVPATDSCPYPPAALARGDTGTVILLINVAPDGRATDARIETSSGSEVLDEAAASCVREFGHFLPKRTGARAEAGWFRMKFRWSFGD
jgi:TonB family protein